MTVWFVQGKLGSGKSILSVSRIKDRLERGLPVATNLNINLANMIGRNKKNTRLLRLPDKPVVTDFELLGSGNRTYDESKNGLIVLDECGTWFNSRDWNDKSRKFVIDWLLHARKLGWDIIFIIQDISMIDKQARTALAEHVVTCKRTDRLNIPFLGSVFKLITGSKLPVPKFHIGIVTYGDSLNAMRVDTWTTQASSHYGSYDTKQLFLDNYNHGLYSVLPPYFTHGWSKVPLNLRNIMRFTKIYLKKYSRVFMFLFGFMLSSIVFYSFVYVEPIQKIKDEKNIIDVTSVSKTSDFKNYLIASYSKYPNQKAKYVFINEKGNLINSNILIKKGFNVVDRGSCEALIVKPDTKGKINEDFISIYCG